MRFLVSLLAVYVTVAATCGIALNWSRFLWRQELQTINRFFEIRQWLVWSAFSLQRLNIPLLLKYHDEHEIPRSWWAWDYTLSWLLEHNHPQVKHKIILFNHLLEDEPPREALKQYPWLEPLLHHPLPRETVADMIEFLASSGVRLIVLDNDFPQYTKGDARLAEVIHNAATGKYGRPVPVLMARTVNRRTAGNLLQLEVPSTPSGLIEHLSKLEPGEEIVEKYTGITGTVPDEDQVIRRIAVRLPSLTGNEHESIIVKALKKLGENVPDNAPDVLDIDFASPPNSELYPVRPWSYLLDPQHKKTLVNPPSGSTDVTLDGAIVFIGDSITDVYSTPLTNAGINQMSGSEILVHGLETLSRGHWPHRLHAWEEWLYIVVVSLAGGLCWTGWKAVQHLSTSSIKSLHRERLVRSLADLICFVAVLSGAFATACMIFAYGNVVVPVFVPSIALALGTIGSLLWEREQEREELFRVRIESAEERLVLAKDRYEADLKRQEAEAKAREFLIDQTRRHEFVRRINHDLNAPVSVLNWTLSELQEEGLDSGESKEKVGRLIKTSDKLCELIDQLVQSYDYETQPVSELETTNLTKVVEDSLDLQRPLADMHESKINLSQVTNELWVHGNALELSRVIDNIVRNAIKHNPLGTTVNVTLQSQDSEHVLDISDNGKGIAPQHLEHIFEPGYRVDYTRRDSQGLGLDIVKTLVERMGGGISVTSSEGEGTTFTVKLPACSATAAPPEEKSEERRCTTR